MKIFAVRIMKMIVYVFAAIGFFRVASNLTYAKYGLPLGATLGQVINSPDNSMKAVSYAYSVLASGCTESIVVVDSDTPIVSIVPNDSLVFETDCGGDGLHFHWEPRSGTHRRPLLRIDADPADGYYRSRSAMGGSVHVAYRNDP